MKNTIILILLAVIISCGKRTDDSSKQVSIIPQPMSIAYEGKPFIITKKTTITLSMEDSLASVIDIAKAIIKEQINLDIRSARNPDIRLSIDPALDSLTKEGYILKVDKGGIDIKASSPAGLVYGVQSFRQLLPFSSDKSDNIKINGIYIVDKPQYKWRGIMLDVARHWFDKDYVKRFCDILSYHKINKLHLHLTDDIAWRLEIMKYPELTNKGAWREQNAGFKDWENCDLWGEGDYESGTKKRYGGFFTQDEMKDIVVYASKRGITVIPEIEMPGHSGAALKCYPQFICDNLKTSGVYCAGKEDTFEFIENILSEVADIFPSEFIHVGGDEVGVSQWESCPSCKRLMAREGLENGKQVQSYFMKRAEKILAAKGKRLIGWDEIIEGGLSENASIMSWTGFDGGIHAANEGHDVVMSPMGLCYLDHYQSLHPEEPQGWGGLNNLKRLYEFSPIHESISEDKKHHILGGQGNLWTEDISTKEHVEYMIMPRINSISEALWSRDKDWSLFVNKIDRQLDRYDKLGYNYSRSSMTPSIEITTEDGGDSATIVIDSELGIHPIHYTLDGSIPDNSSPMYTAPFKITELSSISAVTMRNTQRAGRVSNADKIMNKAIKGEIIYAKAYSQSYSGGGDRGLIDNMLASKKGDDPSWQGFENTDVDFTLDLKQPKDINRVSIRFFQHLSTTSVVLPLNVTVYGSLDGMEFEKIASKNNDEIKDPVRDAIIKNINLDLNNYKCRYIKVTAQNIGILPQGYNRAGSNAWIFMDEIRVN